jgi:hypothetical protein
MRCAKIGNQGSDTLLNADRFSAHTTESRKPRPIILFGSVSERSDEIKSSSHPSRRRRLLDRPRGDGAAFAVPRTSGNDRKPTWLQAREPVL